MILVTWQIEKNEIFQNIEEANNFIKQNAKIERRMRNTTLRLIGNEIQMDDIQENNLRGTPRPPRAI